MSDHYYPPNVQELLRILARIALRQLSRNASATPEPLAQRDANAYRPRRPYRRKIDRPDTSKM